MSKLNEKVEAIFEAALALETDAQRVDYLNRACPDPALRREVESLLAAHQNPDSVFDEETVLAPTPLSEGPGTRIGRYKLLQQIGEGGMGVVYMAEQEEPVRRRVALKIIKLGMDTKQVVARFEAERQALALMDHPNIAKVLDGGATETGRPYFVMELVQGVPITDFCDKAKLSAKERLKLFIQVCQAIQSAHQKGIIHRDIKPSNVLVTLHDGVPVPKVIDFGIAKATNQKLTEKTLFTNFATMIGTPAYMSPEQAEMSGLDIDTRTDIYALGVLLYALLTGTTPFPEKRLRSLGYGEMQRVILEEEPERPSTRLSTMANEEKTIVARNCGEELSSLSNLLKGDLDWIVMKCLEKDRQRRYETANGLASDIQRHLNNEPVIARPPSASYRFQKLVRRNKLTFVAVASVIAALLVGLLTATWSLVRERTARKRATVAEHQQELLAADAEKAQGVAAYERDRAREQLYDSLVREARSIRQARQLGYRRPVFNRIGQALELNTTNKNLSVLRHEAAACLGDYVGLDPLDISNSFSGFAVTIDSVGALAAFGTRTGLISLRDAGTGAEVLRKQVNGSVYRLALNRTATRLFVNTIGTNDNARASIQEASLEILRRDLDGSWISVSSRPMPGLFGVQGTEKGVVARLLDFERREDRFVFLETDEPPISIPCAKGDYGDNNSREWQISWSSKLLATEVLPESGGRDSEVEVWNLVNRRPVVRLAPQNGKCHEISFGPDDRHLASAFDNEIVVQETAHFKTQTTISGAFFIAGVSIGGDGTLLAVPLYQENAVSVVSLMTGQQVAYLSLPGSPRRVRFNREGTVLLAAHASGARVIRLRMDREQLRIAGHARGVTAVVFSPDGLTVASTGNDRALRLWNAASGEQIRVLEGLPGAGQFVSFSRDGQHLVSGDMETAQIWVWSVATGERLLVLGADDPTGARRTHGCVFGPDDRTLVAVSDPGLNRVGFGLRIWELDWNGRVSAAAKPVARLRFRREIYGSDLSFSSDGQWIAFKGGQPTARLAPDYDWYYIKRLDDESEPMRVVQVASPRSVQACSYLPRSGGLMYVTEDRRLETWDFQSNRATKSFPTLEAGQSASTYIANFTPSPDESKIAIASPTGLGVEIRELPSGRVLYSLPESTGPVWWLAWSPDGKRLAVSRPNGEIAIWNLPEVESVLTRLGLAP